MLCYPTKHHYFTDSYDNRDDHSNIEGEDHKLESQVSKEEALKAIHTILSYLTGNKSKGSLAKASKNGTGYLDTKGKEDNEKPQNKIVNPIIKKDSRRVKRFRL